MFKGALQQMMNAEFDSSMAYSKYDKKIEIFNPYAFDLGNTFQKFGWSIFCFKDYEYIKKLL